MSLTAIVPNAPGVATPEARRVSRRRDRYAARYALWKISNVKRIASCGRFEADSAVGVSIRATGSVVDGTRRAGLAGVQSCGSTWACPVCSEKIQAVRQQDVSTVLERWMSVPGREVIFGTFTMQHRQGQGLEPLWNAVSEGFRAVTSGSGRHWRGDREEFGIDHYLRVVEVTHGVNGWHVHVHTLLFVDRSFRLDQGPLDDHELYRLRRSMFGRWRASLRGNGFDAWEKVGADLRRVSAGDALGSYFAKTTYARETTAAGAAFEVTGSVAKRAGKGRTPFQILRSCVEPDDVDQVDGDVALWREWEKVSKGRRQLVWSRKLREAVGMVEEKTDQEVVDEDHGGDTVVGIGQSWYADRLASKAVRLLEWAEADDTGAILRRELLALVRPPDPLDY